MYKSEEIKLKTLKKMQENKEIIVFDFETSGLSPQNSRIIQVAALKLSTDTLTIMDKLCLYINPGFYVDKKIEEITGITNEFLKDKPKEAELFPVLYDFFGKGESLLGGYNSDRFDIPFLNNLYKRNDVETLHLDGEYFKNSIDVYHMATYAIEKKEIVNHKLETVLKYYEPNTDLCFHNAMDDVVATTRLLRQFLNLFKNENKAEDLKEKPRAGIYSIQFWKGKAKEQNRIYVNTNYGTLFFDIWSKEWRNKDEGCIEAIDMKRLISDCYKLAHVNNQEDFAKAKQFG